MSASEWLVAVATVLLAVLVGALLLALLQVIATLRNLRRTVNDLRVETVGMISEMRLAVRDATFEVDRVDALLTTAESVGENLDSASRLLRRTVSNPVVKVIAFSAGTKRAVARLRKSDGRTGRPSDRRGA
ncbi:MAG: hypothetical protein F2894_06170 [Actinobacteria bacterium]|uniref:Unannotated protein n=1 Tax=freshwater metagenome TaxID=449393 RepID=A0A6J7QQ14_9ZZZZ|nr:hypothetical protein [Actinomycetota bacterium]MSW05774.1 hypothetical protein [Actinomycetota bacterium]MSZ30283.1 hypothetical protein [Actinomycetota bacterium]